MRRVLIATLSGAVLMLLAAGSTLAAKPDRFVIDVSSAEYEAETEGLLFDTCGFAIDFEGTGHIITHVFNGHPRMIQISNYRLFETFSANGKTVVVKPDSGPDRIWIGNDGVPYLAIIGRSVTGSGVAGRTVINLATGELVSSNGHELGDFFAFLCAELAPPD